MKNKECNVIRDLLPNYMEKLTSDDTNRYIENHIKECKDCGAIFRNMQADYKVTKGDKKSKDFVDFAKKYNRKFKSMKFFVIIIILFFTITFITFTSRKYIILSDLERKLNNVINANNYHYRIDIHSEDAIHSQEIYIKEDKYMYISSIYDKKNYKVISPVGMIIYYDGQKTYMYQEDERTKTKFYTVQNSKVFGDMLKREETKASDILLKSIFSKIDTEILNGKECYRIIPSKILSNNNLDDGNIKYIEKNTGIPLRSISTNNSSNYTGIFDINIELNTMTDNDLVVPNIKDYKPYEEVKEIIEIELDEENDKE